MPTTPKRYRPTYSVTLDPDVRSAADKALPHGKIRSFSVLVEHLLLQFLESLPRRKK